MFRTKPGEERALVEEWINRPALRKLVETYGGNWPTGDLEAVVAELVEFSEIWDYRAGKRDRHLFHETPGETQDPHSRVTTWAAGELGMSDPLLPSEAGYDYLLILGGLATGVEPRVEYAAKLLGEGLAVRQQVAALGSFRLLQERELSVSSRYAPTGVYEIDHLSAMVSSLCGLDGRWAKEAQGSPAHKPNSSTLAATYSTSLDQPNFGVYAAASSDPSHRPANTVDTYLFMADMNNITPGTSILIVTSAIYAPYQHFDAVRSLRSRSVEIETIGVRRELAGPTHPAAAYRQEVRSALRSAALLLEGVES